MGISQANFVELIRVDPISGETCLPNARVGSSRWQNPLNRFDVDGDGEVGIDDFNVLQDWLLENGSQKLSPLKPDDEPYVDVNGDGWATSADLDQLSDLINNGNVVGDPDEDCYSFRDISIQRDLIDPSRAQTLKSAAPLIAATPFSDYTVYRRDFNSGSLTASTNNEVSNKDSIVFIHDDLLVREQGIAFISQPDNDDLASHWTFKYWTRLYWHDYFWVGGDLFPAPSMETGVLTTGAGGCLPKLPVLDRISARLSASEILPQRFLWSS